MKLLMFFVLFNSYAALACPNLDGYYKCPKTDSNETQYVKIKQNGSIWDFEDKISIIDYGDSYKLIETVRNYKFILGLTKRSVNGMDVEENVNCSDSSLLITTNVDYDGGITFIDEYSLNQNGDLVYKGLSNFICKRKNRDN